MKKYTILLFLVLFAIPIFGQQKPLTNPDVLTMVKSGLSSEIVIAKIKSSTCAFDTSPKTLADLKTSGVPDAVILAVVQCPRASEGNASAPQKAADTSAVGIGQPRIPENTAYQIAHNEPDAAARIKLLDDFVSKYPTSALLPSIYGEYARSYYQSKDYAKAIEYADKVLAAGEKANISTRLNGLNARALAFMAGASDSTFQTPEFYTRARDAAKAGLQVLSQWQKPETLTDEQYTVNKKNGAITFNSAAGMATAGLKDYLSAVEFYKAALALNPNDAAIRFRLGAAYFQQVDAEYSETAFQDGFWEVSRSIQLKGASEAQARAYLRSQILRYQGQACETQADDEINQLLSLHGSERPGIVIAASCGSQVSAGSASSAPAAPTSSTSPQPVSVTQNTAMPRALRAEAYTADVSAGLPAEWHQQLNQQEGAWASQIIRVLKGVPDFPKVTGIVAQPGVPPQMQINAWEQGMKITIPVEMVRFLEDDPNAFAFLVAHEAGHAKQEEIYGQSCYTANNVAMSKFDWVRTLADVAGGAATGGAQGAAAATANIQKQACEDNADTWAVHFLRQTGGADPTGGLRLFSRLRQFSGFAGWKSLTEQFTATHSIDEVRIAHISALLLRKEH